jgi:hypothetical protein
MKTAISPMAEEIAVIKCELAEVVKLRHDKKTDDHVTTNLGIVRAREQLMASRDKPATYTTEDNGFTMTIHRTVKDMTRRKRNVVVTGLPETADTGREDCIWFNQMCELFFPTKPLLAEGRSCLRKRKALPS